jgi:hypothetical protein
MNKQDLARRLARESHRSSGKAADDVDTLVYNILKNLKQTTGKSPSPPKQLPPVVRKSRSRDQR